MYVHDRAVAPLQLCRLSRARTANQSRSQGHWQVMADRIIIEDELSCQALLVEVTKITIRGGRQDELAESNIGEFLFTLGVVERQVCDGYHL